MELSGVLPRGSTRPYSTVRVALQRFVELGVFALLPLIIPLAMVGYLLGTYDTNGLLLDFRVFSDAGSAVLQGHSPYSAGVHTAYPFVYPAPAAFLIAPLTVLPWKLAVAIFWFVSVAALMVAVYLLGVRDWRCYGAVFASIATVWALEIGTLSPLLVLAASAAWRYRDRLLIVSFAIAFGILTKLFLWPLVVWLLATKRFRTAAATAAAFLAMTVGGWAIIGFAGLADYPHYLGRIAGIEQYQSYSTLALARSLGLSAAAAHLVAALVAGLALALVFFVARGAGGDTRSFIWAIGASLAISPIVWAHYFVLCFVPIAIARRRLSVMWLLPLGYWTLPHTASGGSTQLIVTGLVIAVMIIALSDRLVALKARPKGSSHRRTADLTSTAAAGGAIL